MNVEYVMLLFIIIYYTVFSDYEDKILMVLSEIGIFILAVLIKNKSDVFHYLDSFFIKVAFRKTKDIETIETVMDEAIPPFMRSIFYTIILLIVLTCCFRFFIFVYRCIRENAEEHRRGEQANEKDL